MNRVDHPAGRDAPLFLPACGSSYTRRPVGLQVVWTWVAGMRRRRAERAMAAWLVTNAILEIRLLAGQGPEHLPASMNLSSVSWGVQYERRGCDLW
ncbi:MAG: hypothetical protein GEU94_12280 [Micromonosporaceae bacterium]|nr:hypothetical protein [Micromonosporaceae bacterium]